MLVRGSPLSRRALVSLAVCVSAAVVSGGCVSSGAIAGKLPPMEWSQPSPAPSLPGLLSNAELWGLTTGFSEAGGYFPSDNFTSNETGFPGLVAALYSAPRPPTDVYIGVGPEQNFHYIAALRPRMAFIVDIRRQAVMQHLMYKAIFEMAPTRAAFVSLLFSKPHPLGIDTASTVQEIWNAFWDVPSDTTLFVANVAAIQQHLTQARGFALSKEDLASVAYVYDAFFRVGPTISYTKTTFGSHGSLLDRHSLGPLRFSDSVGTGGDGLSDSMRAMPPTAGPGPLAPSEGVTFASLMLERDYQGVSRSFMATEESYGFVRGMHMKNLIIPVVGDFAGPKAIRSIGDYVRRHGATVSAFYVSNVESYLFRNRVAMQFYDSVDMLPLDDWSLFIRPEALSNMRPSSLCPMVAFLRTARQPNMGMTYETAQDCLR